MRGGPQRVGTNWFSVRSVGRILGSINRPSLHLGGRTPVAVAEIFMHRGEQWRRIAAEPMHDRFIVGLDLGQSNDPTAVCVHHHRKVCDTWTTVKLPSGGGTIRQDVIERFDVRHLARLPLGLPYPAIVTEVADILARPPLRGDAELVVDQTGCGAPPVPAGSSPP